VSIWNRK